MKLTTKTAESKSLKPGLHGDGAGLYLHVHTTGSRSWIFRFQMTSGGKRSAMGLGAFPGVGLAVARSEAQKARALVVAGINPVEHRDLLRAARKSAERRRTITFAAAAEKYIDGVSSGWKSEKHLADWRGSLVNWCSSINAKPVADITLDDVERVMRAPARHGIFWLDRAETASRLLQRILLILAHAADHGWRDSDTDGWGARLRRRLPVQPSKAQRVRHHAALPFEQLPAFVAEFASRCTHRDAISSKAMLFGVLCASRFGEVRGATWGEIDLGNALWTIAGRRMKAGAEHRVALSRWAVGILASLPLGNPDELVFPGIAGNDFLASIRQSPNQWVDANGHPITFHGFRATFRTWCAETQSFPGEVVEMALAHTIKNPVERAYRRGDLLDKRRLLAQAWADFAFGIAFGECDSAQQLRLVG